MLNIGLSDMILIFIAYVALGPKKFLTMKRLTNKTLNIHRAINKWF